MMNDHVSQFMVGAAASKAGELFSTHNKYDDNDGLFKMMQMNEAIFGRSAHD